MIKVGQLEAMAGVEEQGRRAVAAQEAGELAALRDSLGSLWDPEERAKWRAGCAVIEEWHAGARRRANGRTYQLATMYLKINKHAPKGR